MDPRELARRPAVATLVVVVAMATVTGLWWPRHGAPAARAVTGATPTTIGSLPGDATTQADLGSHLVFYTDPGMARVITAGGKVVADLGPWAGPGPSDRPVSFNGTVVFVHDGSAWVAVPPFTTAPQELGPATHVFGTSDGRLALELGHRPGPVTVVMHAPQGSVIGAPINLPVGTEAVAGLRDGLLLDLGGGGLELFDPGAGTVVSTIGAVQAVIDTSGNAVAWTDARRCDQFHSCELHVTDMGSGSDDRVPLPAGFSGFAAGGAFSPDGTKLAAFVRAQDGSVHAAVVDLDTDGIALLQPSVDASGGSQQRVAAAWTADGAWIFFGGPTGALYADRPDRTDVGVALPVAGSLTFTVL
ncbi:MAG: TolB family protein [Acidimicrobiales bacterium]